MGIYKIVEMSLEYFLFVLAHQLAKPSQRVVSGNCLLPSKYEFDMTARGESGLTIFSVQSIMMV